MPVTNSAVVETLTAEVRVLMVGSRQVTLSVYRQLDWVDWDDIEPFGRVNDKTDTNARTVVGKDRETGGLVRSQLHAPDTWDYNDTGRWNDLCREQKRLVENMNDYKTRKPELEAIIADEKKSFSDRASAENQLRYLKQPDAEAFKKISEQIKELERWHKQSEANKMEHRKQIAYYESLPLIVLAGLR